MSECQQPLYAPKPQRQPAARVQRENPFLQDRETERLTAEVSDILAHRARDRGPMRPPSRLTQNPLAKDFRFLRIEEIMDAATCDGEKVAV